MRGDKFRVVSPKSEKRETDFGLTTIDYRLETALITRYKDIKTPVSANAAVAHLTE